MFSRSAAVARGRHLLLKNSTYYSWKQGAWLIHHHFIIFIPLTVSCICSQKCTMVLCHTILSAELTLDLHLFKMNVEITVKSKPLKLRLNNSYFCFWQTCRSTPSLARWIRCSQGEEKISAYMNTETDSGPLIILVWEQGLEPAGPIVPNTYTHRNDSSNWGPGALRSPGAKSMCTLCSESA